MPRSTSLTPGRGGNDWGDGANLGRDIGRDPKVVRDERVAAQRKARKANKVKK